MRMTRTAIVTALLLVCMFAIVPAAAAQDKAAPKEHTMTGCLQKGATDATFQLTDLEKGPKIVEIVQTSANLTPHVGHKVAITGTAVQGKPETHSMNITAVKHVSPSCP